MYTSVAQSLMHDCLAKWHKRAGLWDIPRYAGNVETLMNAYANSGYEDALQPAPPGKFMYPGQLAMLRNKMHLADVPFARSSLASGPAYVPGSRKVSDKDMLYYAQSQDPHTLGNVARRTTFGEPGAVINVSLDSRPGTIAHELGHASSLRQHPNRIKQYHGDFGRLAEEARASLIGLKNLYGVIPTSQLPAEANTLGKAFTSYVQQSPIGHALRTVANPLDIRNNHPAVLPAERRYYLKTHALPPVRQPQVSVPKSGPGVVDHLSALKAQMFGGKATFR